MWHCLFVFSYYEACKNIVKVLKHSIHVEMYTAGYKKITFKQAVRTSLSTVRSQKKIKNLNIKKHKWFLIDTQIKVRTRKWAYNMEPFPIRNRQRHPNQAWNAPKRLWFCFGRVCSHCSALFSPVEQEKTRACWAFWIITAYYFFMPHHLSFL